ncbi:DNA-3-methyladenine glycosylase I [Cypionkella aquatica]|uniref:DNA-3-methyladenine glycosylase I n=1 Tax=Cypionkella aquatica TaxID=1756042 RepID=A0AA37TU31_9RHOB|nr:DNA-3-methyladenine glycosylase I [Cypionkella aquatica]GLS87538.1 DNA-3-methyladenine glycosylase I [Cypionkella aquatica]
MIETSHRCSWCGSDPVYVAYHDEEWGRPEYDPRLLFECLILEGFQAGLSWITILRRRDGFRAAFAGFDPAVLAGWGEAETLRLLADPGIIRHRGKIEATFVAARAYLAIEAREGFANFLWKHVGGVPQDRQLGRVNQPVAQTPESVALSKALKAEGFKFVGPTISFAFMQAVGMVNDHHVDCPWHGK